MGKDLQLNVDVQESRLITVNPYAIVNKKEIVLYEKSFQSFLISFYSGSSEYVFGADTRFIFVLGTKPADNVSSTLLSNVVENDFTTYAGNTEEKKPATTSFSVSLNTDAVLEFLSEKAIAQNVIGELWMFEPGKDGALVWQNTFILKPVVAPQLGTVAKVVVYKSDLLKIEGNDVILCKPDGSVAQTW